MPSLTVPVPKLPHARQVPAVSQDAIQYPRSTIRPWSGTASDPASAIAPGSAIAYGPRSAPALVSAPWRSYDSGSGSGSGSGPGSASGSGSAPAPASAHDAIEGWNHDPAVLASVSGSGSGSAPTWATDDSTSDDARWGGSTNAAASPSTAASEDGSWLPTSAEGDPSSPKFCWEEVVLMNTGADSRPHPLRVYQFRNLYAHAQQPCYSAYDYGNTRAEDPPTATPNRNRNRNANAGRSSSSSTLRHSPQPAAPVAADLPGAQYRLTDMRGAGSSSGSGSGGGRGPGGNSSETRWKLVMDREPAPELRMPLEMPLEQTRWVCEESDAEVLAGARSAA
ncbi:hypothetical protein JB92DRAFT_383286 [Gautieria morchelliformis]|nr:hypothetical protein JB92DRAFT_383286 [Gautieria morchelliformis]